MFRRRKKLMLLLAGDRESALAGKARYEVNWDDIRLIAMEQYRTKWIIKFVDKNRAVWYHPAAFSSYDLALLYLMQNYARLLGGA